MTATALLLLAILVIVVACRLGHLAARAVGQPPVMGEIIVGVLLGPTLFGAVAPDVQRTLFHPDLLAVLGGVSQLGLVLFMFTVGLEFPTDSLRRTAKVGLAVSAAGLAVPLALGVAFTVAIGRGLVPDGVGVWTAALFIGFLLSITAFPVMARMITDYNHTRTRFGTVALTAGAVDDAAAWVLLAGIVASTGSADGGSALIAVGGLLVLAAALALLRPLAHRFLTTARMSRDGVLAAAAALLLATALYAELIGVHAVFGAFALGAVLARTEVSSMLAERIRPLTVALFLPLFFVYSGMKTDLGLVVQDGVLLGAALLIALAFMGKLGSCTAAARLMGERWSDSVRIGCYMNARGLMQLVALNIGLQAGLVTETVFAMVVMVAIVTTVATGPGRALVDRVERRRARSAEPRPVAAREPA
jgi:Kef-type K+ transport system membrane component KefB